MKYAYILLAILCSCTNPPAETTKKPAQLTAHTPKYSAYTNYHPLSDIYDYYQSKESFSQDGVYKLKSLNGAYYMISYPYSTINPSEIDFCSGISQIFDAKNDSLLYETDRYFGMDNTFLSDNGECIAYVNEFLYSSDYDVCSKAILQFYKKGDLLKSYADEDILTQKIDADSWLYPASMQNFLSQNTHYLFKDTLYVISAEKQVLLFDINVGNLLQKLDTATYLNNLSKTPFPVGLLELLPIEEVEGLPLLSNHKNCQNELSKALNVHIAPKWTNTQDGLMHYHFSVKTTIDQSGNCLAAQVNCNEIALKEEAAELSKQIKTFLEKSKFKRKAPLYGLQKWRFETDFYLSKRPQSLARQEYKKHLEKLCAVDSIRGVYIPKDLEDAHKELDKKLSNDDKLQIQQGANTHFGLGTWIRNNWGLWAGARLYCFFNQKGINHPDNISSLILQTYTLKLNGEAFVLDSIIAQNKRGEIE